VLSEAFRGHGSRCFQTGASKPRKLFQNGDARVLAPVCHLGALAVPPTTGLEAPFATERFAYVTFLFESPDLMHGRLPQ
jgi:hypothetical protein